MLRETPAARATSPMLTMSASSSLTSRSGVRACTRVACRGFIELVRLEPVRPYNGFRWSASPDPITMPGGPRCRARSPRSTSARSPFSRRGSWLDLSPVVAQHDIRTDVHLVSHRTGLHAVLALIPGAPCGPRPRRPTPRGCSGDRTPRSSRPSSQTPTRSASAGRQAPRSASRTPRAPSRRSRAPTSSATHATGARSSPPTRPDAATG